MTESDRKLLDAMLKLRADYLDDLGRAEEADAVRAMDATELTRKVPKRGRGRKITGSTVRVSVEKSVLEHVRKVAGIEKQWTFGPSREKFEAVPPGKSLKIDVDVSGESRQLGKADWLGKSRRPD